ncbi:MAG: hypothetical protein JSW66_13200 [Phycisphaerales bacterium]|nr:MAG: hypothetical protein JSW66_13200 [Phycisphaerales bacterium]
MKKQDHLTAWKLPTQTVFQRRNPQKTRHKGILRKIQASQGGEPMNDIDIWKWVALKNGQCGYVSSNLLCLSKSVARKSDGKQGRASKG